MSSCPTKKRERERKSYAAAQAVSHWVWASAVPPPGDQWSRATPVLLQICATERVQSKMPINWEEILRVFGMNMYTLLCFKPITNKDLLYSTRSSAQCYMAAWMQRSLGENGYMYMHGWVPLLSTWNYHNIVNQLYSNTKHKGVVFFLISISWRKCNRLGEVCYMGDGEI